MTCHIDAGLIEKRERGKFVDLERLLPGEKVRRGMPESSTRLEWCVKEGNTYLAPAEKEKKISNVRKWDQAFRIYATFYCRANPTRTGEIWQYMDVIHTAANAYIWDNVAYYDYVFRQLMEFNPSRNWGSHTIICGT